MIRKAKRRGERGQTIILVAISIVSLLAMAALAIDVVTLYVASSEIKRAADAAALAGAKGIADSGVTTLQAGDGDLGNAQILAQKMATAAIIAILPVNTVAGAQPMLVSPLPIPIDWTRQGNPIVTVSLRRDSLPTFFAKIWGRTSSTVSASATAEAYSPSNNSPYTPIAPSSVKPWLVANEDPFQPTPTPLIQPTSGTITSTVVADVMAKSFDITADCGGPFSLNCNPTAQHNPPQSSRGGPPYFVEYVPAQVASPANTQDVCPSSCPGSSDYEQSIQCADATSYQYLYCGGGTVQLNWNSGVNPSGATGLTATATECLIHASGPGPGPTPGQDTLDDSGWPSAPPQITAGSGPYATQPVSTSSSIVTIPIIDTSLPIPLSTGTINIVGFLQAFINGVEPGMPNGHIAGDVNITVLNIVGCANSNANSGNPPVVGGTGTSPVPVRLIAPPSP